MFFIFFAFSVAVVLTFAALQFYLHKRTSTNSSTVERNPKELSVQLARAIARLTVFVLYIPITSGLLRASHCSSCNTSYQTIVLVLGILGAILLFILTTLLVMMNREQQPNISCVLARSHSRADLLDHVFRTVVIVIFGVVTDTFPVRWILALVFAAYSLTTLWAYTWMIPYYAMEANIFHVTLKSILAWAGLSLVIVQAFNDSSKPIGAVLFYAGFAVVASFCVLLVKLRHRNTMDADIKTCSSEYEIEMKVRFYLEVCGLLFPVLFSLFPFSLSLSLSLSLSRALSKVLFLCCLVLYCLVLSCIVLLLLSFLFMSRGRGLDG